MRIVTIFSFFITLFAITYLALSPAPPQVATTLSDKFNHTLAFGTLTILGRYAFPWFSPTTLLSLALTYGTSIEIAQLFIPNRSCDARDILADMLGTLLALSVLKIVTHYRQ